jgi:hypothetical protein
MRGLPGHARPARYRQLIGDMIASYLTTPAG